MPGASQSQGYFLGTCVVLKLWLTLFRNHKDDRGPDFFAVAGCASSLHPRRGGEEVFCRAVLLWTTSRPRGCRSSLQTGEKQRQLHADQFNHKQQSRGKTKALPELLAMPGRQQHLGPLLKTILLMRAPMLGWNPGLPTSLLLMCWVNWPTTLCVCCCHRACRLESRPPGILLGATQPIPASFLSPPTLQRTAREVF